MCPIDWTDVSALGGGTAAGEPPRDPAPRRGGATGEPGGPGAAPDALAGGVQGLLDGLNEPQREAATHAEGPLLILAGAGSGKTRVITRRVVWLMAEGGARPWELLAITFTNKAAREMRERVEAMVSVRGPWISTFHSMCARILRREIEVLGERTSDFSIYDTYDKNQLLKELIKDSGYDVQRFRPAMVGGWISDRKNAGGRGGEVELGVDGFEDEVLETVLARYEETMRRNNALDFDDLQLEVLRIFDAHPGVRDAYATRFRYVMVDEYQDTNRVQYLLTRHLAGAHGNLAVCGDPDQSIYAWRGADVRNILDFEQDFPGARVVKLEQNYRSTGNVLKAAQAVVRHNVGRKEKDLWTEREDGALIGVLECADENDEADEIARQVRALQAEGRSLDGIAIFYRVNFMQRALERALRLAGIPYQIVGGVEFFQRREIRDLVAYLRLIANPADDVSFRRVVNVPARGIGEKSLEVLSAWAAERGVPLLTAAGSEEARAGIRGRARAGLAAFAELFLHLSELREAPAAEVLDRVLGETDYLHHLGELGDVQQASREENVEELRVNAETYDRESPDGGLRGFLQDIALVSDVDGYVEDQSKVTLMTMHSAKGLEFPVVFVAGLEEELMPHSRAIADVSDEGSGIEEERRLMYVAMTRAQERLYLTHATSRWHFGAQSWRQPSRFLDEIPEELIEGARPEAEEDEVLGSYEADAGGAGLQVGDWVEHPHFGRGLVERLQGAGINARASVSFTEHGTKRLLLQYAKLTVLRSGS